MTDPGREIVRVIVLTWPAVAFFLVLWLAR